MKGARRPLAEWLDETQPGWRTLTPYQRGELLAPLWKNGTFKRLRISLRNDPVEAVKIERSYYGYVEFFA